MLLSKQARLGCHPRVWRSTSRIAAASPTRARRPVDETQLFYLRAAVSIGRGRKLIILGYLEPVVAACLWRPLRIACATCSSQMGCPNRRRSPVAGQATAAVA